MPRSQAVSMDYELRVQIIRTKEDNWGKNGMSRVRYFLGAQI